VELLLAPTLQSHECFRDAPQWRSSIGDANHASWFFQLDPRPLTVFLAQFSDGLLESQLPLRQPSEG